MKEQKDQEIVNRASTLSGGHQADPGQLPEPSIEFFDDASQRNMAYVYPDSKHWTAGWVLWKHPDGQWVTLRKATDADITAITGAVSDAHHFEAHHSEGGSTQPDVKAER